MPVLANSYLVLFLADAAVSVLDVLVSRTAGSDGLQVPRGALALAVVLMTPPMYVALGLRPGLPRRVLLPLCIFALWPMLGGLPLPLYLGISGTELALSLIQLGLAVLALVLVRRHGGGERWLLSPASVAHPPLTAGRALRFFGVSLVAAPLALVLYVGFSAALATDRLTAGFMSLDHRGLHAEERIYERDDRRIHLVPMMHIGDPDYYRQVRTQLPTSDTILLQEGVSDEDHLIPDGISYSWIAERMGLGAQEDSSLHSEGQVVESADVDVSEFSETTIGLLAALGRLGQAEDPRPAAEAYRELSILTARPEVLEVAMRDILDLRNEHLIGRIDESLDEYSNVVVPWGAAHMPALEQAVLDRGFSQILTRLRDVIHF